MKLHATFLYPPYPMSWDILVDPETNKLIRPNAYRACGAIRVWHAGIEQLLFIAGTQPRDAFLDALAAALPLDRAVLDAYIVYSHETSLVLPA